MSPNYTSHMCVAGRKTILSMYMAFPHLPEEQLIPACKQSYVSALFVCLFVVDFVHGCAMGRCTSTHSDMMIRDGLRLVAKFTGSLRNVYGCTCRP